MYFKVFLSVSILLSASACGRRGETVKVSDSSLSDFDSSFHSEMADSVISDSAESDSVSNDEGTLVPVPVPSAPAYPSLPFNPQGTPWVSYPVRTEFKSRIYDRDFRLIAEEVAEGKGLVLVSGGWKYDFLEAIPELSESFFNREGGLIQGCKAQLTAMDYDSDGVCEILVSLSSPRQKVVTYIFRLHSPGADGLPGVEYSGERESLTRMHVSGGDIVGM